MAGYKNYGDSYFILIIQFAFKNIMFFQRLNIFKHLNQKNSMDKNLIIVAGLPGAGKQTSAERLSKSLGDYRLIDQNELRRKEGMKRMPKKQDKINREIDRLTLKYLRGERGVIILSGHRQACRRNQLYGIASAAEKNAVILECVCSEAESRRRMSSRPDSDGLISKPNEPQVYDRIKSLWEPIEKDFRFPGQDFVSYLTYNTEENKIYRHNITRGMGRFIRKMEEILLEK